MVHSVDESEAQRPLTPQSRTDEVSLGGLEPKRMCSGWSLDKRICWSRACEESPCPVQSRKAYARGTASTALRTYDETAAKTKAGWFDWLGWGKAKAEQGKERVEKAVDGK